MGGVGGCLLYTSYLTAEGGLLIFCRKYWQATIESSNKMEELYKSMERAFPMIIVTGFIGGMGTVISSMTWYEPGIGWAMSLKASPCLLYTSRCV